MVLPRWLARFNRRLTNPILGPLAIRWSPFAVVHHVGRHSGRRYITVLMSFPTESGLVFALTYGPDADWVRNVLSAGTFAVDRSSVRLTLGGARLVPRNEAWPYLPAAVRFTLRLLRVKWFLVADRQ